MPPLVTTLSPFLSAAINWANFFRWRCAGIIIRKYMMPNSRTIRIMNWKEPPGAVACATRGASIEGAGDINSQPPDSREFRDDFISATRVQKTRATTEPSGLPPGQTLGFAPDSTPDSDTLPARRA